MIQQLFVGDRAEIILPSTEEWRRCHMAGKRVFAKVLPAGGVQLYRLNGEEYLPPMKAEYAGLTWRAGRLFCESPDEEAQ